MNYAHGTKFISRTDWFGLGALYQAPISLRVLEPVDRNRMLSRLYAANGAYLQNRYSPYDAFKVNPANHCEAYSGADNYNDIYGGPSVTVITDNTVPDDFKKWRDSLDNNGDALLVGVDSNKELAESLKRNFKKCISRLNVSGHNENQSGGVEYQNGAFSAGGLTEGEASAITAALCPDAQVNICACLVKEADRQALADVLQRKVCSCSGLVFSPCRCDGVWSCTMPKAKGK